MIDGVIPEEGTGPGADPGFQEAVGALYGVAYTPKFEQGLRRDAPRGGVLRRRDRRCAPVGASPLRWRLLIVHAPWITRVGVSEARGSIVEKKGDARRPAEAGHPRGGPAALIPDD